MRGTKSNKLCGAKVRFCNVCQVRHLIHEAGLKTPQRQPVYTCGSLCSDLIDIQRPPQACSSTRGETLSRCPVVSLMPRFVAPPAPPAANRMETASTPTTRRKTNPRVRVC